MTAGSGASALSVEEIEQRVLALLPEVRERGEEIASLRRLPRDLVDSLKKAGAFRMSMPTMWGGPEMSLHKQVELVEALAVADPSVGWCVYDAIDATWARLCAGERLSDQERVDLMLSRVQSFRVARDVALAMVQLAGTQAIYATSVLDRLLRDAVTINQHVVAGPIAMEAAGQLSLGQQPTGPTAVFV